MSPAERYAHSTARRSYPHLAEFTLTRPFTLDPFQIEACQALEDGHGVLVCAPTGAGKTVVGEFAVHQALATGGKCFYTTPIKALSNQKFADLIAQYGPDRVGLLTGDTSLNSHAQVVVMTTEVLRNMLYSRSADLTGLTHVVMDEIHYLADKFRGAVWEEVILQLAAEVQVVGLSATVSNAEEFGAWLAEVRGELTVVVDEIRPVPLWQHMLVGRRLFDLFGGAEQTPGEPATARLRIDPGAGQGRARCGSTGRPDVRWPAAATWWRRGGRRCRRPIRWARVRRIRRHPVRRRVPGWPAVAAAAAGRRHRETRRRRAAAGHHLHLLPGRLRRRGHPVRSGRYAADHREGARGDPADRRPAHGGAGRNRSRGARVLGVAGRPRARASPRTTPGCCRCSRRPSRNCSSPAW